MENIWKRPYKPPSDNLNQLILNYLQDPSHYMPRRHYIMNGEKAVRNIETLRRLLPEYSRKDGRETLSMRRVPTKNKGKHSILRIETDNYFILPDLASGYVTFKTPYILVHSYRYPIHLMGRMKKERRVVYRRRVDYLEFGMDKL